MLLSLSINNYALISKLDIDFHEGFSIITGETGAGKSILLGALSMILGQRADSNILKEKSKKCIIEGSFNIGSYNLQQFFKDNDLDYEEITILRREINTGGKSRAFINDTPVKLNILKEIGFGLVDIHSQHKNLILNDKNFQINVIDVFASIKDLLSDYKKLYFDYNELEKAYKDLLDKSEKAKADLDYFSYQFNQLENGKLKEGEQEELEAELEKLTHAEEIKSALDFSRQCLSGEDRGVMILLKDTINKLDKVSQYFPRAKEFSERITSVVIELKDIADESGLLGNDIEFSPSAIEEINNRLDLIYGLQQKHKASDIKSLIDLKNKLAADIENIKSYDLRIEKSAEKLKVKNSELEKISNEISQKRKRVIPNIENIIIEKLIKLGISHADFKIEINSFKNFLPNGRDRVLFKFSANKKSELQEISTVASGGEMSRLMLSIKSLISSSTALPTIVFDEIDSGISGEIGDKMGDIIKEMSADLQLINITHLPQIARKGDYHYLVYKYEDSDNTFTDIKLLNHEERVIEIAKMLSGADVTQLSIKNARELLVNEKKN